MVKIYALEAYEKHAPEGEEGNGVRPDILTFLFLTFFMRKETFLFNAYILSMWGQSFWESLGPHLEWVEDAALALLFGVAGYPTLVVIDSEGKVRHAAAGSSGNFAEKLRGELQRLANLLQILRRLS
ncbi:MAG: hypothetical protein S4CHLAM123_12120 [Chlamydiales bacterium]|nr:hypothetical protein [Chlamydiales bacterium]